jgi:hypothetical protein
MRALHIYAGKTARAQLAREGLQASQVRVVPAAAGGPKGLILGPLDRFIFGAWLTQSTQAVHLVGASIGAWRMATACLNDPLPALERLERDYIAQHYELAPGQKRVPASLVSQQFRDNLDLFYGGRIHEVLAHPRYRLHVLASRGRGLLHREHPLFTPLGYALAIASNALDRRLLGLSLERVVFSAQPGALPFASTDFRTHEVPLLEDNFMQALQASCSIPFLLQAVHGIAHAPPGAYWDGGITDYHLHLNYRGAASDGGWGAGQGIVLYPHFQKAVVPGWLDKPWTWRHASSAFLDAMVVLAPNPEWVRTLPNGKLPDRTDFKHYGNDLAGRMQAWNGATSAARQLADEFAQWLEQPAMAQVLDL